MSVRRRYSREFKVGAVKLVTEQGYTITDAAKRLEIDRKSMKEWIEKFAPHFEAQDAARDVPEDPKALQAELRRLRQVNERLRAERDILKKAAAYFAKDEP